MNELIRNWEHIFSFISAVGSVAAISFLIRFWLILRTMKDEQVKLVKEQKALVEEQKKAVEEQKKTVESRLEAAKEENSRLKSRLDEIGVTAVKPEEITIPEEKVALIKRIQSLPDGVESDSEQHLLKANALSIDLGLDGSWNKVAWHYDQYLLDHPTDWEAQFARAVAYANKRDEKGFDDRSLKIFNEAVEYFPQDGNTDYLARLHLFRGRAWLDGSDLEKAEHDLLLAGRLSSVEEEKEEISWNLAKIYEARAEKGKLATELNKLAQKPEWEALIRKRFPEDA
ncbi:MAG: hypothetical protein QNK37_38975 [Acidobacteriota bacterium]|nr:hypothetical protein [Acidobacteriota bacterium]